MTNALRLNKSIKYKFAWNDSLANYRINFLKHLLVKNIVTKFFKPFILANLTITTTKMMHVIVHVIDNPKNTKLLIEKVKRNIDRCYKEQFFFINPSCQDVKIKIPSLASLVKISIIHIQERYYYSCAEYLAAVIGKDIIMNPKRKCRISTYAKNSLIEGFAEGVIIRISGRLRGKAISRKDEVKKARVQRNTIYKNIFSCTYHAATVHGIVGVHVIFAKAKKRRVIVKHSHSHSHSNKI